MSNEYKDWLDERVQEILLDNKLIDKSIMVNRLLSAREVIGLKDGNIVKYKIWFDEIANQYQYERSNY